MVDSNDRERIPEAREELQRMLNEDELRDALLLVFANKQDLPNAMNAAEITDKLGLHSLRQRQWYVEPQVLYLPSGSSRPPALRAVTVSTRVLNGYVDALDPCLTAAEHQPQASLVNVMHGSDPAWRPIHRTF